MGPADILSTMEIGIPLYLVISYVAIISLCLLLTRIQLGLAVSFLFVFYLGYFYNRQLLLDIVKGSTRHRDLYSFGFCYHHFGYHLFLLLP